MHSRLWSSSQRQVRRTCAPPGLATVQGLWYRQPRSCVRSLGAAQPGCTACVMCRTARPLRHCARSRASAPRCHCGLLVLVLLRENVEACRRTCKYTQLRYALIVDLHAPPPKVAACICLFSLDKAAAVPVDTHVWQLAAQHYLPHLRGARLRGCHALGPATYLMMSTA